MTSFQPTQGSPKPETHTRNQRSPRLSPLESGCLGSGWGFEFGESGDAPPSAKEDSWTYEHFEVKKAKHAFARVGAESLSRVRLFCDPVDCSPARLLCPGDSPGKNIGVGCHALLQGIFPTRRSNPRLLRLLPWQAGLLFFTTSNRLRSSCIQIVKWEMQVCPLSRPGTPCRAGDPRTHSHLWISVRRHPAIILHFVYLP